MCDAVSSTRQVCEEPSSGGDAREPGAAVASALRIASNAYLPLRFLCGMSCGAASGQQCFKVVLKSVGKAKQQLAAVCSLSDCMTVHGTLMQDTEDFEDPGGHDAAFFPPTDSKTDALQPNCGKKTGYNQAGASIFSNHLRVVGSNRVSHRLSWLSA